MGLNSLREWTRKITHPFCTRNRARAIFAPGVEEEGVKWSFSSRSFVCNNCTRLKGAPTDSFFFALLSLGSIWLHLIPVAFYIPAPRTGVPFVNDII